MEQNELLELLTVNIIITKARKKQALQIRTTTSKEKHMKKIIEAAWNNQALLILPTFRNKLEAIATLQQEKIIERDEEGNYQFLI